MMSRHIIAMGGGGFSMEPDNPFLDEYVLGQTRKPNPTVCFLPTASGDSDNYIVRFYTAFSKLPCQPRHLPLFQQPRDLSAVLAECDVIYVGGGNTRNMLTIWRACQLDSLLQDAWKRGVVLCGVSAGAICWFEHGHTDSAGSLDPIACLGFLSGSCTPHYNGEAARRPSFHDFIRNGSLPAGYGIDDGAAIHFVGEGIAEVVSSRQNARAFHVCCENGEIIEQALETRFLGDENTS